MERRVVITGLGAITPIGNNVEEFWNGIKEGKCGIDEITRFDTSDFKVKLAGEVKGFSVEDYIDKREAKRMDRFSHFAIVASREAWKDSGLNREKEDMTRVGVIVGSGIGGIGTIEKDIQKMFEKGPDRVSPMYIPMTIGNMAAGNVTIDLGAKGESISMVTACASGTHCIGESFRMIKHGYQDIIVTGGTEASITPSSVAGFTNIKALTQTTDKYRASIPFDKERNGFVMGEGAGIVVLEELEHAKARGAHIYCEMVGYGVSCDAYHMTAPAPEGIGGAKAMINALQDASLEANQIDYINAHGTSTPMNDKLETAAIKKAFKNHAHKVAVSSTKGNTGHCLGAAGGIEGVLCVKALEDNFIPATINYQNFDEECDLDIVANHGRKQVLNYVMSNSLGFGGHNASIIFKKYGEE